MNEPFADEYFKVAEKEIDTLEEMGAWDVVKHNDGVIVINATRAFKIKQSPNGTRQQFEARFCALGDQQLKGIGSSDVYSPVVKGSTVCLILILENLLGMKSKQADVTAAFLQATLGEDEKVYAEMLLGFKQNASNRKFKVLCCNNTLYGSCQSPCAFQKYLTKKLGI